MTVRELIADLLLLPQDANVEIIAPGDDAVFRPTCVEALRNEEAGIRAVIWTATTGAPEDQDS